MPFSVERAVDHDGLEQLGALQHRRSSAGPGTRPCRARLHGRWCSSACTAVSPCASCASSPKLAGGLSTGGAGGARRRQRGLAAQRVDQQPGAATGAEAPAAHASHHGNVLLAIELVADRTGGDSALGIRRPELLARVGAEGREIARRRALEHQVAGRRHGAGSCRCPHATSRLPSASPDPRPAGKRPRPPASARAHSGRLATLMDSSWLPIFAPASDTMP